MLFLLSVLLWLGVISSPETYTTVQIDTLEYQYQPVIQSVQANPPLADSIWNQYGAAAEEVKIIEPWN